MVNLGENKKLFSLLEPSRSVTGKKFFKEDDDRVVASDTRGLRNAPGAATAELLSLLRSMIFMMAALGWGFCGFATAAIINEPMTNATAPSWVIGGTAYLTASGGLDPVGNGWLRLTDAVGDQAGSAFLDQAFDISNGVMISFDYATWGGAGSGYFRSTCFRKGITAGEKKQSQTTDIFTRKRITREQTP